MSYYDRMERIRVILNDIHHFRPSCVRDHCSLLRLQVDIDASTSKAEKLLQLMSERDVEASIAEPSLRLTTAQKERVDEAFVELFGCPFSNDDAKATWAPPPRWLCDVLSSEKQAARIWRHLPSRKQRQLATRVLRKQSSLPFVPFRSVPHVPPTASIALSKGGSDSNATRKETQQTSAISAATNTTTAAAAASSSMTSGGNRTSLAARVQQLTSDAASTSTLAKTAMDWELFKEEHAIAATLEEQATQKTAYLPKQEFLQRVDVRTYEKSREAKQK